MYRPCALIPAYNHAESLPPILAALRAAGLPILLIDDGSDADCAQRLQQLAQPPAIQLLRHPQNRGKGAAVQTGLKAAAAQGFSHALQIDADGQHCLADIDRFLDASRQHPEAVVIGQPVFDGSVPKVRFYGRYATHVWVWIHCLSFAIQDSMCGFRVYPVAATTGLLHRGPLGQRMDFDTEVLVRLFWTQTPVLNLPTAVSYPVDGRSHFRFGRDNWLLTRMHTRLFLGMLWRLPGRVARRFTGSRS